MSRKTAVVTVCGVKGVSMAGNGTMWNLMVIKMGERLKDRKRGLGDGWRAKVQRDVLKIAMIFPHRCAGLVQSQSTVIDSGIS